MSQNSDAGPMLGPKGRQDQYFVSWGSGVARANIGKVEEAQVPTYMTALGAPPPNWGVAMLRSAQEEANYSS